jgi:hypothetical protein
MKQKNKKDYDFVNAESKKVLLAMVVIIVFTACFLIW